MTDLEFSKCQATSPVSHLGRFISSTSESSVPILDPISGSMKVSTREQLDISFDTGVCARLLDEKMNMLTEWYYVCYS